MLTRPDANNAGRAAHLIARSNRQIDFIFCDLWQDVEAGKSMSELLSAVITRSEDSPGIRQFIEVLYGNSTVCKPISRVLSLQFQKDRFRQTTFDQFQ